MQVSHIVDDPAFQQAEAVIVDWLTTIENVDSLTAKLAARESVGLAYSDLGVMDGDRLAEQAKSIVESWG